MNDRKVLPLPLAAASAEPERPSLAEVFRDEVDYVWNTFRRLGIPSSDLQDLTQELFLTLHHLMPDYDPSRPIRPWLFTIAYRMAARHQQRSRREQATGDEYDRPDSSADLDRHLAASEERALVLRALEYVEIHRRAVFVMADIDEVSVPEIAMSLGIPLNTAYSRLRLARQEFREAVRRITAGAKP